MWTDSLLDVDQQRSSCGSADASLIISLTTLVPLHNNVALQCQKSPHAVTYIKRTLSDV